MKNYFGFIDGRTGNRARLTGAMRLMNARLPGATFCSRRYGDGIDMRYFVTDSLYGMKKSRLDRCYRDNVIAVAKEKTKAALDKAKRFAGENPRLTKALGIMLAALATGSAVAIAKARKKVQPEFEYIGPKIEDPGTSKNIKEAFSWFKKAEESFGDKYNKFSGKPRVEKGGPRPDDIVVDSLYGRKRLKKKLDFSLTSSTSVANASSFVLANAIGIFVRNNEKIQSKLDVIREKLTSFASAHPMIAKLVRILIKIHKVYLKIRGAINVTVLMAYVMSIAFYGRQGIDAINKLTGLKVVDIKNYGNVPANLNKAMVLFVVLKSILTMIVSQCENFVEKNLKPIKEQDASASV